MTKTRRSGGKGPSSGRVRSYNWTWFKAIEIGEKFVFGFELDGLNYSIKVGTCEKISARKYKYTSKQNGNEVELTSQVGSIDAIVVKLNKHGEPDRVSDWTPNLSD